MRRIPSQVPSAVSRLLQASVLQTPPTWYQPVLSHPPPQLPPRGSSNKSRLSPSSSSSSSSASPSAGQFRDTAYVEPSVLARRDRMRKFKQRKNGPLRVVYEEDAIRRQFFKDFAFEALRPTSLVEGLEIDQRVRVDGEAWERLEQRGAYPTVEDTVSFVLNLRKTRGLPLSEAYANATSQFVALRARHELATMAAETEARHYGAQFKPDAFERQFNLEEKSLSTLLPSDVRSTESSRIKYRKQPRYKWTNTVSPDSIPSGEFTRGQAYMQKWNLPKPVVPQQGAAGAGEGDLLSAIPSASGAAEEQSQAQEKADEGLAFLQSVLSKARS